MCALVAIWAFVQGSVTATASRRRSSKTRPSTRYSEGDKSCEELYGPRDVRFEEHPDPTIIEPTDAIIRISATCVCGSDLWPYRGIEPITQPTPMGHEYCGIVAEVGSAVRNITPGQFVVG